MHLPVLGKHNVLNSLAALAAADSLGVDPLAAAGQISLYTPPAMRQQVKRTGSVTILDDSYNSSPDSVQSSLDVLRGLAAQEGGRRVAVLADMLELGDQSQKAHFDMGIAAARMGVDWLIGGGAKGPGHCRGGKMGGDPLGALVRGNRRSRGTAALGAASQRLCVGKRFARDAYGSDCGRIADGS